MIDDKALVDSKAKIGKDVSIGPFTVIGPNVEIGDGTKIDAHTMIQGHTKIGKNNTISHFVTIGAPPQDLGYKGEPTRVEIGDENIIREYTSIHRATTKDKLVTKVGNKNLFMAYTHIAHDCIVGNGNIFANNATLAGSVEVADFVGLGGFVKVLQFIYIGSYSFITGSTDVYKDIPPYVLVAGQHGAVKPFGLNVVGLSRRGFSKETLKNLRRAYKIIYRENLKSKEAVAKLETMLDECPEVQGFIDVLNRTKKGIVR